MSDEPRRRRQTTRPNDLARWLIGCAMLSALASCDQTEPFQHDLLLSARDTHVARLMGQVDAASRLHVAVVVVHWMGAVRLMEPDYAALAQAGRPVVLEVQFLGQLTHTNVSAVEDALRGELARAQASHARVAAVSVDYRSTNHLDSYATLLARWRHDVLPADMALVSSVQTSWLASPHFRALAAAADEFVLHTDDLADPAVGHFDRDAAIDAEQIFERRSPKPFWLALPAGGLTIYRDEKGVLLGTEDFPPAEEVRQTKKVRAVTLAVLPEQVRSVVNRVSAPDHGKLQGIVWVSRFTRQGPPAWSVATWRDLVQPAKRHGGLKLQARQTDQPGLWDVVVVNPLDVDLALPEAIGMGATCSFTVPQPGYASWYAPGARSVGLRQVRAATVGPGQSIVVGVAHCGARPEPGEVSIKPRDAAATQAEGEDDRP